MIFNLTNKQYQPVLPEINEWLHCREFLFQEKEAIQFELAVLIGQNKAMI